MKNIPRAIADSPVTHAVAQVVCCPEGREHLVRTHQLHPQTVEETDWSVNGPREEERAA